MPWEPGQSGNPDGPRKYKKFLASLERSLLEDDGKPLRAITDKLRDAAISGEPWAIQMVADRLDGKAVQQLSADIDGGNVAIALVAYHPAQLPAKDISASSADEPGLGDQASSLRLASQSR